VHCKTCGVYGHDSQGSVDLCLTAIKDRMFRWAKVAGQLSGALTGVKLAHAARCDASECAVCTAGMEAHKAARAMAAEDGLI
jgi:hypothetical protein